MKFFLRWFHPTKSKSLSVLHKMFGLGLDYSSLNFDLWKVQSNKVSFFIFSLICKHSKYLYTCRVLRAYDHISWMIILSENWLKKKETLKCLRTKGDCEEARLLIRPRSSTFDMKNFNDVTFCWSHHQSEASCKLNEERVRSFFPRKKESFES
jgi:hypothetical protein